MSDQDSPFSMLNAQSSLLAALQLADSFFPTGMYTQSHGLESFVSAGCVGAERIEPLLRACLLHAAGPSDALAARWVVRAAAAGDHDLVAAIDSRLEATKLAAEVRLASRRCGGRLLILGADTFGGAALAEHGRRVATGDAPGHQAVALALIAAAAGLGEDAAVLVELHGFAVSLLGAAVRLGALDHAAAQKLLLRAHPAMTEASARHAGLSWRDIGGFAPEIDVMQFRHRYADMHMFVS